MTDAPLLLALHSCSETFGVAVSDHQGRCDVATFADGRGLSNTLITRVESVLPRERWRDLAGVAVATGPGGFTGTRLSVVLARTLAQQLGCPLLGVSSYALMAARLQPSLPAAQQALPFWICRELPRRGTVAGQYQAADDGMVELQAPHLLPPEQHVAPALDASDDVAPDVERLLMLLQSMHAAGQPMPWQGVLPLYPTSPVGPV
ncbi:MAG: tRNA (adenosine(37)-N6)-threonylcarbamoyltransferase complex dimerization subunit type 1 TsaB [Synechococcus sp.]